MFPLAFVIIISLSQGNFLAILSSFSSSFIIFDVDPKTFWLLYYFILPPMLNSFAKKTVSLLKLSFVCIPLLRDTHCTFAPLHKTLTQPILFFSCNIFSYLCQFRVVAISWVSWNKFLCSTNCSVTYFVIYVSLMIFVNMCIF